MDAGYVLVIGSAGIDTKGRPGRGVNWGTSNRGRVSNSVGGVARNIAENLSRLGVETVLLTAVGADVEGKRVLDYCETNGVDCSHARVVDDARTGSYLALLKPNGELETAICDYEIMESVDSSYLLNNEDLLADARFVVIDATLSEPALRTLFELIDRHGVPVCADPTTASLARRFLPYMKHLHMIAPNALETAELLGLNSPVNNRDKGLKAARQLGTLGPYISVVTMGELGLAYADRSGAGFVRALPTQVVDSSGAGDALASAIIFGLLNHAPIDEAMRLGVTAASLTLQTDDTVLRNLSQELLYERLVM